MNSTEGTSYEKTKFQFVCVFKNDKIFVFGWLIIEDLSFKSFLRDPRSTDSSMKSYIKAKSEEFAVRHF